MLNPLTHRRKQRKILANGIAGRARVVEMGAFPDSSSHVQWFRCRLTLHVQVEGVDPYEVEDEWLVPGKDTAALTLGETQPIPVVADPDDHQKVAIDWDGARRQYDEHKAARRDALASGGSIDPPANEARGTT